MANRKPKVVFIQRKRRDGVTNFSLEQIFDDLRNRIAERYIVRLWIAPCVSSGLIRRGWITLKAAWCQADINHVTGDINFATCLMRRSKTVLTILDCAVLERTSGIKRWIIWLCWFQIPSWRSAYITVISESTRISLLNNVSCNPAKIRVIPVAISQNFTPNPGAFNNSCPTLLQVGTAPNKNLIRVAEALKGMHCRLQIIGALDDAQQTALSDNNISYSQSQGLSQDELIAQYQSCDMLIFASTCEGFGMPILEANAIGRPVITSNLSSMPEVAGNAACLVDPTDAQSIRAGVIKVIDQQAYREKLVENGFANVKRFRPDAIADQYAKLYEQVLNTSATKNNA